MYKKVGQIYKHSQRQCLQQLLKMSFLLFNTEGTALNRGFICLLISVRCVKLLFWMCFLEDASLHDPQR